MNNDFQVLIQDYEWIIEALKQAYQLGVADGKQPTPKTDDINEEMFNSNPIKKELDDCKTVEDCDKWVTKARETFGCQPYSATYRFLLEAREKRAIEIKANGNEKTMYRNQDTDD